MITYITHPDVVIDPDVPVPMWPLSERGRARMEAMLVLPWVKEISAIYCSGEQKALDGAAILGTHLDLAPIVRDGLGENDRSSTGYLPQEEFIAHATRFFTEPELSIGGWEPAQDAQDRIVGALKDIGAAHTSGSHVTIIAHGGVGALLLTSLMGKTISMDQEQPGQSGGNYFSFDAKTWTLLHGWRVIN